MSGEGDVLRIERNRICFLFLVLVVELLVGLDLVVGGRSLELDECFIILFLNWIEGFYCYCCCFNFY